MRWYVTVLLLPALPLCAQDGKKADPGAGKVDAARVEEAIRKGVEYLRKQVPSSRKLTIDNVQEAEHEFVLWTFLHAGVPETDADFRMLLKEVMGRKMESTYDVSLKAMCLRELDRVRYQAHLGECAQFLVDNQCKNGQWAYGGSLGVPALGPEPAEAASAPARAADKPGPPPGQRPDPAVRKKIVIKKLKEGPASGDNSNSQYAALGLRACFDSGIVLPKESLERARKQFRDSIMVEEDKGKPAARSAAWTYEKVTSQRIPYCSMTAGAVGTLAIYDRMLGIDWAKDADVKAGLTWLGNNFTVTSNAGVGKYPGYGDKWMQYYYLYALERAGMLLEKSKFGSHEWYPEGAAVILAAQQADGSWPTSGATAGGDCDTALWNTCWAILFLKRGTRPLVASEDRFIKRDDGDKRPVPAD
jgi:hypothetical protein